MTVGHTPLVVIGVRVTPDARVMGLALCTTDKECVQVQAQAMAQSTPSTRALSVSVHALNSLFWKDPHEPLTQNSVTFVAKETVSSKPLWNVQKSSNKLSYYLQKTLKKSMLSTFPPFFLYVIHLCSLSYMPHSLIVFL